MLDSPRLRHLRYRPLASGLLLAAILVAAGCESSTSRAAAGVLRKYRKASGAKPLTAGGMIRVRLKSADGTAPTGLAEILWEPWRYRECVSSAGMTTCRGIEWGKAYFTDEDGVTRVVSDPVLRELYTRSYFWRRAWLFEDRERAWLELGPQDAATVSLSLRPEGGNPLLLTFSRSDGRLLSARSPRFHLDFSSTPAASFSDVSDPRMPVDGEIAWVGLPTGRIPHATVGGERAEFGEPFAEAAFEKRAGAVLFPARLSGQSVRIAIDGAADGPVRVSPRLAARLGVAFSRDVFGRSIAAGASLSVGSLVYPSLFVQISGAIPGGSDAAAGGCLFREAIVEIDPSVGRLRFHDPARWVVPEAYFRAVIDDDGDRPVAVLYRGGRELRLTAVADTGDAALRLAAESAARAGVGEAGEASGLTWGALRLAPLRVEISRAGFFPDWGDDGALGFPLLLRFHVFVNMPQRWTYLRAAE